LSSNNILLLAGDGIGAEVAAAAGKVIRWFQDAGLTHFTISEGLVGGASYEAYGVPLTDATIAQARSADAVLFGAIGGPQWDHLPFALRPERAILGLRKELGLFANLRPASVSDALTSASPLKAELVRGLDLMIVRELLGGVYFGTPRGIESIGPDIRRATNTQSYTTPEIVRVARVAFDLARTRKRNVCSVDKANVMESGVLWREEVGKLHAAEYGDVELSHMYADNCAMQIVRAPRQFDVILTDNLFGDILSDLASMLTGSLGMLPSASLRESDAGHRQRGLYEPIHGSAPDIAGRGIANPLAMILSVAMMLRYSFDMNANAELIEKAVQNVLAAGVRTADIAAGRETSVSTTAMCEAVIAELVRLHAGAGLRVGGAD
jgi:3-isopropylmalate dehydrogenase